MPSETWTRNVGCRFKGLRHEA